MESDHQPALSTGRMGNGDHAMGAARSAVVCTEKTPTPVSAQLIPFLKDNR